MGAPATAGPCYADEKPPALEPCIEVACPPGWGHVSILGTGEWRALVTTGLLPVLEDCPV